MEERLRRVRKETAMEQVGMSRAFMIYSKASKYLFLLARIYFKDRSLFESQFLSNL